MSCEECLLILLETDFLRSLLWQIQRCITEIALVEEGDTQLWRVWLALSSFRVGLNYKVALTKITSFLGQPTPAEKGQAISILCETFWWAISRALRFTVLLWGLHCSLTSFSQYCFPLFPSQIWLLNKTLSSPSSREPYLWYYVWFTQTELITLIFASFFLLY